MTTNGNGNDGDPFRGREVPLEIQEHIAALLGWIRTHPDDSSVRQSLKDILSELSGDEEGEERAPQLPDWVWTDAEDIPPRRWVVNAWLPEGRVAMLAGRGGAGKSRLALQLAAGVASGGGEGDEWIKAPLGALSLGTAVPATGAPVVYVTWEDEPEEFARRLDQISGAAAPWVTPDQLQNLHVINLAKHGPLWAPLQGRHVSTLAELTETGRLVRERVEQLGAGLLIIDPLAAAYAGDENSRALVRAFVADWDGWAQEVGCAVLLVAHPPKGGSDYSGTTDWEGAVRSMWVLKEEKIGSPPSGRNRDDRRPTAWQLSLPKRNYSVAQPPLQLLWDNKNGLRWRLDWWETPKGQPPPEQPPTSGGSGFDLTV